MAKSDAASTIISLPKEGGALHGIGETFSPDLFTGTGNFSIPIALPPGRTGLRPELNLIYSTGNGRGHFGLGWDLSIPGVSRKTSKGVPRYRDAEDVFILPGAEDLVSIAGDFSRTIQYRPRTEGLFARITYHCDSDNSYWKVQSKDGLVSFYGTLAAAGSDPAVVAEPTNRTKAFAWKLTRTDDWFGNRIEYEYEQDQGEENGHHWDQLYLKHIRLGNGSFDLPREMREASAGLRLADPGVQFIGADDDGRIDLLVTSRSLAGYFPTQPDGLWDGRSFQRYRQAPSLNLQDPEVQLV